MSIVEKLGRWLSFSLVSTTERVQVAFKSSDDMTSQNAKDLYGYKPNTIANGFFLAIFSLCLLVSLAITAWTRRCIFSSFVLICANVFAIVSYAERIVGSSVGHYIIDNIFAQLGPVFTTIG